MAVDPSVSGRHMVPLVDRGPHTWDHAARVKGQIQFGRPYAKLTSAEHEHLIAALSAVVASSPRAPYAGRLSPLNSYSGYMTRVRAPRTGAPAALVARADARLLELSE